MLRKLPTLFFALIALVCAPAWAEDWQAQVVAVIKGDTLVLSLPSKAQHTVRLSAVEAPELDQAHGNAARQRLQGLALNKTVRVQWTKRDAFGRVLGKVFAEPSPCPTPCDKSLDLGLSQLEAGLAWWSPTERREQTLLDQGYYEYAQFDARSRRIGLWIDPEPVPPWEWRKKSQVVAWLTPSQ
jgi:endonuclease YncB( thermonuclease family)